MYMIEKTLFDAGDSDTLEGWNKVLNLYSENSGEEFEDMFDIYKSDIEKQKDVDGGSLSIWDIRKSVNEKAEQLKKPNVVGFLELALGRDLNENELINTMTVMMLGVADTDNYSQMIEHFHLVK